MSEPTFKAPRPLSEIQTEYAQCVQRAGQCQYQIVALKKDLDMYNNALRDLNAEAFAANEASKKAEAEKKAADDAAVKAAQSLVEQSKTEEVKS